MRTLLTETENWLYDEGEDVEKKVYEARLAEMKKFGDPVQERHREFENRRNAFDDFDRILIVSGLFTAFSAFVSIEVRAFLMHFYGAFLCIIMVQHGESAL